MKTPSAHIIGSSLMLCLTAQSLSAQDYSIDWYKVAAGGGLSTGGIYSVAGTIGQPDGSLTLTGGGYSVTGGFWSLITVVQTTNIPILFIGYSGGNITVQWQAQNGWVLQENPDLKVPSGWTNSFELVTVNGVSFHSVANPSGALFFRLKR